MRIIHVITRLIIGGAQENTLSSVLGLRQKPGFDVQLVSGPSTGPEGSLEHLDPHLLTVPHLVRAVHPYKDSLALRELENLFDKTKPEIVHTHSGKAGVLGRIAAARAGVPIIVHTIHGPSFGNFQGPLANFVFRAAERRAARVTTHFVTVADAMTEQYLAAGIGRREQYSKIFSGFDLTPFLTAKNDPQLRSRLGIANDDIVIGKIARLFKLKGHDDLFAIAPEIVRQNPRIKFLLVGDGEWRTKFENKARALNLEKHTVFAGLIPPDEVSRYVGIMDLLVHLSLREGLPRALPQALAAAKPVIAYDCDGAREVCFNDKTGFLLQPGDLNTLTDRLLRLASNPTLRENLGRNGQEFVRGRFSTARMVDDLHTLYLKLASDNKTRQHG
jgi:glycosyltransferase involved in cell wall biosynthesis